MPYRRNPTFTGREKLLGSLAAALAAGGTAAVVQVLQGAGGVGKTTLAVEYAYRHRGRFDTVWWARAEQPATLISDLTGLAAALGLAEEGQADQQLTVAAVQRWLADHDRWLLILDNAPDPEHKTGAHPPLARLVDLLPQVLHGQVLVTSRRAGWEQHAEMTELEVFTPAEAVAFLLARSGTGDKQAARRIAELLGYLPLALEQAGAYTREARIGLASYLARLRQFPALTLAKGAPRDRDPADTVTRTWRVSLDQVGAIPGATELLELCAFLAPDDIPRALLAYLADMEELPDRLMLLGSDPFALDDAVAGLRRFGLVKASEQTLAIHRVLQQVVRDSLDPNQQRQRAQVALRLIRAAFPAEDTDPALWPAYAQLLPHALAIAGRAERLDLDLERAAWLLNEAGLYLWQRADYQQARTLVERALAIREARLGPDHPDTADSLNSLADVLRAQGELNAAHVVVERALAIREARLGPDHPDTADSLNSLAGVLRDQGDLIRARSLFERALGIREARLGPDHLDTARSLNSLAGVLRAQGDLIRARNLLERALAIYEHRLGPDDVQVAVTLYRLADVLQALNELPAAREKLERALTIDEAAYGPDHPEVATDLTALAGVLYDQGDLQGARILHERALAIREARLGPDDVQIAVGLYKLAGVLQALNELPAAREKLERALTIDEAAYGPDHPEVATDLTALAGVLYDQGDLQGARILHERALAIREARLGPDHPDTVQSRQNLAAVLAELDEQR